ncbi:MAG: DUF1702 family protein [Pseudonocardia sp.]
MNSAISRIRRLVMGVPDREVVRFSRGDSATWAHLEAAVRAAVGGYHAVLDGSSFERLVPQLDETPPELRGYAYEGAAMGLTGIDLFMPGSSRFRAYVEGPGRHHVYMAHIGAGEALARLRRRPEPFLLRLPDPTLRWLVLDGYGFHEGFFKPRRFVLDQSVPSHLSPFGRKVVDQGVGRSLWFTSGADVDAIATTIAGFATQRHADLWLGVGVGCGYVGGVDRAGVVALRAAAHRHATRLGVGAAFVAKGRDRAGNVTDHTRSACEVLCGLGLAETVKLVDEAFVDVPDAPAAPAYGALQDRIHAGLTPAPVSTTTVAP